MENSIEPFAAESRHVSVYLVNGIWMISLLERQRINSKLKRKQCKHYGMYIYNVNLFNEVNATDENFKITSFY